jgi:hypothetical protein
MSGTPPGVPNALAALGSGLQKMRGGFAGAYAPSFSVYRVSSATPATGVLSGTSSGALPITLERTVSRGVLENQMFEVLSFAGTCDNRNLNLGDLVQQASDGGVYCFAQYRPPEDSIFVRCESLATFSRPMPDGGRSDQQPASGAVYEDAYFGEYHAGEWPLTVTAGSFAYVTPAGSPVSAAVPIGLQPTSRVRDEQQPQIPEGAFHAEFFAYIPPLKGLTLSQRDRIYVPGSAGYQIISLYSSQQVGLIGTIAKLETLA